MTENVVWLDPAAPAEVEFMQSFLPADLLRITAPPPDAAGPPEVLLKTAQIIVTKSQPVTAEVIAAAPELRLIQKYGGRPDRIDLAAARDAGVPVAVMPLRGCIAVAEMTMTLILALSKQLIEAHAATTEGRYRELGLTPERTSQRKHAFQWMKLPKLQEITGKRLGLIGFGEIGTEVAKRANAFQMEVVYHKREPLPPEMDRVLGVRPLPLDELLATSDFVSLHVPHGDTTDHLIGAAELGRMKSSANLINTCRGPVVDEDALIAALQTGQIAGAGLDVFTYEPLPFDSPLVSLPNVILAPHIGGGTGGARDKQMADVLANVTRFAQDEELLHRVG